MIFLQCFYSLEDITHKRDEGGDWGGGGGGELGGPVYKPILCHLPMYQVLSQGVS